jgi:hypothetical protein
MANIYVKSGAGNASPFASWANGAITLAGAAGVDAAGDTIYVSQAHAESSASAQTIALAGTTASPSRVICASDAAEPPAEVATGAIIQTTGASAIIINGSGYLYGLELICGSGGTSANIVCGNTVAGYENQQWENCTFELGTTATTSLIISGAGNASTSNKNVFKNCTFKFGRADYQSLALQAWTEIYGGAVYRADYGGVAGRVFTPFGGSGEGCGGFVDGIDLSGLLGTVNICRFLAGTSNNGLFTIRNSKLPAGWSGKLVDTAITQAGIKAQMQNCTAGSTLYRLWNEDVAGSVRDENTVVRTGGANDGAAYSFKLVSSANCSYPLTPLETPEFSQYNTITGEITEIVEIVTDSATPLKDDEIWLEVSYPGASGRVIVTDAKASVLATAADQASSSADWTTTGLSTPLKQKLSVTFTPGAAGWLHAKVKLAKPSTNCFVDPKMTRS